MQSVLIVIHLLVVIALVAVVLLQRSEGGALGAGGGGGFMTGRGQANALSRATAILGALFFAWSLGRRLDGDDGFEVLVAAASVPMFLFIGATVTNDAAATPQPPEPGFQPN